MKLEPDMHYSIHQSSSFSGFEVTMEGRFDTIAFAKLLRALISDRNWHAGANALFDCTDCDFHDLSQQELAAATALHSSHDELLGNGRMAWVIPSLKQYDSGRLYRDKVKAYIAGKLRIMQDRDVAVEWLNS